MQNSVIKSLFKKLPNLILMLALFLIGATTPGQGKIAPDKATAHERIVDNTSKPFDFIENINEELVVTTEIYILADGQFVYGSDNLDFEIEEFFLRSAPEVQSYSEKIKCKAFEYSINPRVIISLLELKYRIVTEPSNFVMSHPVEGFALEIDDILRIPYRTFYQRLYPDIFQYSTSAEVFFPIEDEVEINPGSAAILSAIGSDYSEFESNELLQLAEDNNDPFTRTYSSLFPEKDPLDDINNIRPTSLPPDGLLKFPFTKGQTWLFSQGPHEWSSSDNVYVWSSLDFAKSGLTVNAAADGEVIGSCGYCDVTIKHQGDWRTRYYHMESKSVNVGDKNIQKDQPIGIVGDETCCGGAAYGSHVHFTLYYAGAEFPIDGVSLEGWIVHNGTVVRQGYLSNQGYVVNYGSNVISDATAPTSGHSLIGILGENNYYRSNVLVELSSVDNIPGSGVEYIEYRLNGGSWVIYSGSFYITNNGNNTLEYRARDYNRNVEVIRSVSFKVDSIPPTNPTSITTGCAVTSGAWQNTCNNLYFTWSGASDATSGLAFYEYEWPGVPKTITPFNNFDPDAVTDGAYNLNLRTYDIAGNISNWKTMFTLKYDATSPTGSIQVKNGWEITNQALVNLNTAATDNASGVSLMRLRDSGGTWTGWLPYSSSTQWILPPQTDQAHIVEVQYQDRAGNVSPVYSDSIFLDIYPDPPSSNNFQLIKSTFGMSGTNASSENFSLHGTLSQESTAGFSSSENFQSISGYWGWTPKWVEFFLNFLPIIMN